MKKLIPLAAFLSSLMFTSACFAEWTSYGKHVGANFYIDFDRIQIKRKRSVFYWLLVDYAKPDTNGDLSAKVFQEADCRISQKQRILTDSACPQPMAQGEPKKTYNKPGEWFYLPLGSAIEKVLIKVCDFAEKK